MENNNKQQEVRGSEDVTRHSSTRLRGFAIQPDAMFFHYGFHKSPATGSFLCQIYPLHSFISCFFNIYFNFILLSTSVTPT